MNTPGSKLVLKFSKKLRNFDSFSLLGKAGFNLQCKEGALFTLQSKGKNINKAVFKNN